MKKQKKWIPSIGLAVTICALLLTLAGCAPDFEGSSVKNADCYKLDIEAMNGTDTHTLELKEGDTLKIRFETVKGSLIMTITAPDGTALYQGDGTVTEFTVEAPMDGAYAIVVVGQKAKGSICVNAEESAVPEAPEPAAAQESDARDTAAVTAEDLIGPWHLAAGENDEAAINETFPGAMEFGSGMEINGDGKISWYIGADGGAGTYTLDGNVLSADMTGDVNGTAMTVELTAEKKDGALLLTMEYRGLTLCWSWGEGETGRGE